VDLSVATGEREVSDALDDAFRVHELRWRDRPDISTFADKRGRAFNRAALAALAQSDGVRLVTVRVAGAPVAFTCSLHTAGRMFLYRLAFDPAYGRISPGILVTLEAIRLAADEGATHVEFLRGTERYKMELGDRLDELGEAMVARGGRAHVAKALVDGRTRAARSMGAGRRAGRQLARALAFRYRHNG
jgi:CelD/BcsL family acetyltransferase involved in cellulose biosynthesis